MTKKDRLVVVDGSNLATEGRETPSLRQLDEAVRAFLDEYGDPPVVVVVDATFEHRVTTAERPRVKQAELAGEIVTPPAGAVGRGDAFILKIAKRAGAAVLSNDSFQEFHAEHPWLFEEGRLIGGKPVARVGWIFTPRTPVRGARSKAATKRAAEVTAAPAGKASAPAPRPAPAPAKTERPATKTAPAKQPAKKQAARTPAADKRPQKAVTTTPRRSPAARKKARGRTASRSESRPAPQKVARSAAKASAKATSKAAAKPVATRPASAKALAEPVNTARAFGRLLADHPVGSTIDGEVVQFTSHGAMVSVPVGRTMHVVCYAPVGGLGTPPPTRARDVLTKSDNYRFTIVSFDSTRRRAELALAAR